MLMKDQRRQSVVNVFPRLLLTVDKMKHIQSKNSGEYEKEEDKIYSSSSNVLCCTPCRPVQGAVEIDHRNTWLLWENQGG